MIGYYVAGCLGVIVGLLFVISMLAVDKSKLLGELEEERKCYQAARWLAQYNYAYMAAVRNVAARDLHLTYNALTCMVDDDLRRHAYYGMAGQVIPLMYVPKELRGAAAAFNRRVFANWPARYTEKVDRGETVEQARIRQLQDAVVLLRKADLPRRVRDELEKVLGPLKNDTPHI